MLKTCYLVVVSFFLIVSCNWINNEDDPVVEIKNGKIRGHILRSGNGKTYYAFQQIPYAAPPVGKYRFQPPKEVKNWNGILDATLNTKICVQNIPRLKTFSLILDIWPMVSENCLHLNVYTPKKRNDHDELLPVLFWIHGGAFQIDDSYSYGPKYFMDNDVIVVTINYRLGPFGFLTTEDETIPGNIGLKDQHMAIKWVVNNIKQFGGDPKKIVIAGESAGAASVSYHLVSEANKGLFRGAILQSGSSLAAHEYQPSARQYAFQLGRVLNRGLDLDNSTELLKLLQDASVLDIIKASAEVDKSLKDTPTSLLISAWVPIIEKYSEDAFITTPMHEAFISGKFNKVPTLLGFNSEEALTFIGNPFNAAYKAKEADQNIESIIDNKLHVNAEYKTEVGRKMRNIYTNSTFSKDVASFVKFLSDNAYITPLLRQAECSSKYAPVYLYQFSRKKQISVANFMNIKGLEDGVGHAEELIFLWDLPVISTISTFVESYKKTQQRFLKIWTNFLKDLNPTSTKDELLGSLEWPTFTSDEMLYVDINFVLKLRKNPRKYKRVSALLNEYIEPPLIVY